MRRHLHNSIDLDIYTLRRRPSFQLGQILWFALATIELLLIMGLFLKAFSPQLVDAGLGRITYSISSITEYLLLPLTFVFGVPSTSGPAFEWMTLLAMLFYWLLATAILTLLKANMGMSRIEIARTYSKRKYGH